MRFLNWLLCERLYRAGLCYPFWIFQSPIHWSWKCLQLILLLMITLDTFLFTHNLLYAVFAFLTIMVAFGNITEWCLNYE